MPIAWTLGGIVQMLTTLAVLGGLHRVLLLLPLAALLSLVAGLRIERRLEGMRTDHAEGRRAQAELFELATTAPASKEVRVFDLGEWAGHSRP